MLAVIPYPQIDPYIFRIGKVGLSWYATSYILGFAIGYFIFRYRYRKGSLFFQKAEDVGLLVTYIFYGVVLGARLFYVLFYNLKFFLENPLQIPAIWNGGMSFHGGLVGGIFAIWIFSKRRHANFLQILDNGTLVVPIALGLGRMANFINGELYGRVTDVPWAMVFPLGGPEPRHPSQLYEGFLEGVVIFFIVWWVLKKGFRAGTTTAVGIFSYGVLRFIVEFFREPDPQLGTVLGPFSMGQILCFAMILFGVGMILVLRRFPSIPVEGKKED